MKILLIILFVLLILCVLVYCVYVRVKAKLNQFSGVLKQVEMATEETAHTPKTINECEGLMLTKILKDFPEFNANVSREIVNSVILKYFSAINENHSIRDVKDRCTEAFCDSVEQIAHNESNKYNAVKIHRTRITDYKRNSEEAVVLFQSALEYTLPGKLTTQCVYQAEYVYYLAENDQGENVSLICENCGAPISNVGNKICEYCGAQINASIERTWKVNKISKLR